MGASMGKRQVGPPGNAVCVVCDDCGRVFAVGNDIDTGLDKKKRCERCAARIMEEKVAGARTSRKCNTCQALFSVSPRISELPKVVSVNCQRCSDTHRILVQNGSYLEVTLEKGGEKLYICCPKSLQGEIKKCIAQSKEQGFDVYPGAPHEQF